MNKPNGIRQQLSCRFRGVWQIAKHTWNDVNENEILTRASAIAFGAMMAAVPFLALVITISALVLPAVGVESKELLHALEALLGTVFPDDAHHVIEEQISRLHGGQPIAVLSVSLAVTIWLASGLFAAVIDGLNRIYGVRDTRPYWKFRLTAIWMTVVQSVILLAAVASIFAFPYLVDWVGVTLIPASIATWVTWFIIFLMVLCSFALTFAAGPDVKQAHRWVTPGSVFGAVIFLLTTYGFRLYVQNLAHYDLTYGSLGGVMMLMFWLYISSLVLLVAGEVNKVCYKAKEWGAWSDVSTSSSSQQNILEAREQTMSESKGQTVSESKGQTVKSDWKFCPDCGAALAKSTINVGEQSCTACPFTTATLDVSPRARTGSGGGASGERRSPPPRPEPLEPFGPTGFGC